MSCQCPSFTEQQGIVFFYSPMPLQTLFRLALLLSTHIHGIPFYLSCNLSIYIYLSIYLVIYRNLSIYLSIQKNITSVILTSVDLYCSSMDDLDPCLQLLLLTSAWRRIATRLVIPHQIEDATLTVLNALATILYTGSIRRLTPTINAIALIPNSKRLIFTVNSNFHDSSAITETLEPNQERGKRCLETFLTEKE